MNKNVTGVITAIVVGGLLYVAYKKFVKPSSKKVVISHLDSTFGGSHADFVNSADKKYIDNWAKAIMKGQSTFTYNNKSYYTGGGKVVQ